MEEEKLGCFGHIWNLFWFVYLILSLLFAWWAFGLSEGAYLLRLGAAFTTATSAIGTVYQVYKKKPDGFLKAVKHEFFITRKYISGSATWIVNRVQEIVEEITQRQTEIIIDKQSERFKELGAKLEGTNQGDINQKKQADLHLLEKYWRYINYQQMDVILRDIPKGHLNKFTYIRYTNQYEEFVNRIENHFYDEELENAFLDFQSAVEGLMGYVDANPDILFDPSKPNYTFTTYEKRDQLHDKDNLTIGDTTYRRVADDNLPSEAKSDASKDLPNQIEAKLELAQAICDKVKTEHHTLLTKIRNIMPGFTFSTVPISSLIL